MLYKLQKKVVQKQFNIGMSKSFNLKPFAFTRNLAFRFPQPQEACELEMFLWSLSHRKAFVYMDWILVLYEDLTIRWVAQKKVHKENLLYIMKW